MRHEQMNRSALNTLIERLESEKSHWHMNWWLINVKSRISPEHVYDVNKCGTAGCFAGHLFLANINNMELINKAAGECGSGLVMYVVPKVATELLGNNGYLRDVLFGGGNYYVNDITKERALALLYDIRDNGILDWSRVMGGCRTNNNEFEPIRVDLV